MKKGIWSILAALLILLPGCTGGGTRSADVEKIAEELISSVKFQDEMSKTGKDTAVKIYGMEAADVVRAGVYESTGATAEEVAAFEAKDGAAAARIREKVGERVETQRAGFQDYRPAEMEKLKDPVIAAKGNYVVLCVSGDNAKAKKVIGSYLK